MERNRNRARFPDKCCTQKVGGEIAENESEVLNKLRCRLVHYDNEIRSDRNAQDCEYFLTSYVIHEERSIEI